MFVLLKIWKDSWACGHSLTLSSQAERSVRCVIGSCSCYPTSDYESEKKAQLFCQRQKSGLHYHSLLLTEKSLTCGCALCSGVSPKPKNKLDYEEGKGKRLNGTFFPACYWQTEGGSGSWEKPSSPNLVMCPNILTFPLGKIKILAEELFPTETNTLFWHLARSSYFIFLNYNAWI